jgi:hypothetical protein
MVRSPLSILSPRTLAHTPYSCQQKFSPNYFHHQSKKNDRNGAGIEARNVTERFTKALATAVAAMEPPPFDGGRNATANLPAILPPTIFGKRGNPQYPDPFHGRERGSQGG